ncbi:MAG: peptidase M28, partial [Fischerella sp.]|nr:peptidase M28 [Fischerella sp.]
MNLKNQLKTHLHQIARERDPYMASAGHFFVQEYIRASFAQWGSVDIHTFYVGAKACKNLILNLPPATPSEKGDLPPILIGAHYDAVSYT